MNQNDREFLHGMMLERMTQHYGASFPRDKERAQRSSEMENKLTHALTLLPEDQVDDVHQYLEYLFERSAEAEELFYRSGLIKMVPLQTRSSLHSCGFFVFFMSVCPCLSARLYDDPVLVNQIGCSDYAHADFSAELLLLWYDAQRAAA